MKISQPHIHFSALIKNWQKIYNYARNTGIAIKNNHRNTKRYSKITDNIIKSEEISISGNNIIAITVIKNRTIIKIRIK